MILGAAGSAVGGATHFLVFTGEKEVSLTMMVVAKSTRLSVSIPVWVWKPKSSLGSCRSLDYSEGLGTLVLIARKELAAEQQGK